MMRSSSLPELPNYVVRIRCLVPPTLSPSSSANNSIMTTSVKAPPTNSFGISPLKSSTTQTTCNICKRLLYSFEEILICRICDGSYHWRCIKPDMISHYGENAHFICDKCNDSIAGTTTNGSIHRQTNGGIKSKPLHSSETDYRDLASIPSKLNVTPTKDTTVVNAIRYFEDKQQQSPQKISKLNDSDGHLSLHTNGQFTDDSKTIRRIQQQQKNLYPDDENIPAEMFQANYQYTPLKEYAAMRNGRTTNDVTTNGYHDCSLAHSDRQISAHYSNGLRYANHGYDSNKPHLVESPERFTSPTVDSVSVHNRQQHFTSTTNVNVHDKSSQQPNDYKNSLNNSTSYVPRIHDNESPTNRHSYPQQQQVDRHSAVGSDSGIVMTNSHQATDENQIIEKKLTNLVQKIGRQLETDAQKLSDKLELKLTSLEQMIHQQTYIIRQQDEVIERLKSQISKIETERDHFRQRLSIHEQDGKTYFTREKEELTDRKIVKSDDQQQTSNDISGDRKYSNTSSVTTENSRRSSKKTPAPRVDHHKPLVSNENEPAVSKLIKTIPSNQERPLSNSSSPSTAMKLASSVPLVKTPAAANRLDNIIHQSTTNNASDSTSSYYNVAEVRHLDPKQGAKPISIDQVVTSIHHDEEQTNSTRIINYQLQRSASLSSSTSSLSIPPRADSYDVITANNIGLSARNSNGHRSLEAIPRKTSHTDQSLKATNKTASLELGTRPMEYDDPPSIYVTPQEATHPASQYQNTVTGWLRKQNRESMLKRIERYYCVLSKNTLLMHKNEQDRMPYKAINLKGAKVLYYQDQKYGSTVELTWSTRQKTPKHYHLYAKDEPEAQQWVNGIQSAIHNLEDKNTWQQYRLNTKYQ